MRRHASTWADVLHTAKTALSSDAVSAAQGAASVSALTRDPLEVVAQDLTVLRHNIAALLGSGHPSLDRISKYYFAAEGKHVRPMIVLLMAKATNGLSAAWAVQRAYAVGEDVDKPMNRADVLNDVNPSAPPPPTPSQLRPLPAHYEPTLQHTILPTQRRLAEITEMIHVASLLHDDVIDASPLRRGAPSAPSTFGNKLSILGGDFLLGRASIALARLRDPEVTELMSTVIANLVEGEVMQLRAQESVSERVPVTDLSSTMPSTDELERFWDAYVPSGRAAEAPTRRQFQVYLQKTYLKTASLMAKSSRSAAVLGGCGEWATQAYALSESQRKHAAAVCDAAYAYGRHVGMAFQLVDDLLDFRATTEAFGKPSGGADLKLGLATAPVLYAWQELADSPLCTLVSRRFSEAGDVEQALELVHRSQGLTRTAQLARYHTEAAHRALAVLPPSDARAALAQLCEQIVTRAK
ncbi:tRNA dimethylallyltransferase [Malassezia nana]|uniref:(2E,6E)-farnesyl diphosphate synthase n=1 Tax=Malassezia nana TaxID=180528 RepID=A0AAF0J218_9BASI|nr:tRNA dimethylallyltransferase [Malassezia nana]